MSKKGLFASLIISCVLTLSLGIYTLVALFGGSNPQPKPQEPVNTTVKAAFRTQDIVNELTGFSAENIKFTLDEGVENPVKLNEKTGKYEAVLAGKVTAVISLDKKGNTKTVEITVYNQGDGSSNEKPYIIASKEHLVEFAQIVNVVSAERSVPKFTKLVSDIDLSGVNWKPIGGQGNCEYSGTFDGNGHTINNLEISVNASNYKTFVAVSNSTEGGSLVNKAFLDLGLFGKVNNAKILNLNVENVNITVSQDLYTTISEGKKPDGAEFDKIVRLTIGTIAGSAYNTDIVGVEAKSKVVINSFNAYSCSNSSQAHGVGGLVGVAQLVRVSNYSVVVNIVNKAEAIKGSVIGGVFGASYSSYNAGYTNNTYAADHKTTINNVDVDFSANLLYKNEALVGGLVGVANNTGITNVVVKSFDVDDDTTKPFVDYTIDNQTMAAGAVAVFRTLPLTGAAATDENIVKAFVSNMENVVVENIDVMMIGGRVAGVIGYAGRTYTELTGVTETMVVKDSTASGSVIADSVGGFAWKVNPGATITYTKTFDNPVVNMNIKAHLSAGFALINNGKIIGFEKTITEKGSSETKVVKTQIKVETIGMGALIEEPTNKNIYQIRNATYASGVVGLANTEETLYGTYEASISNLDVIFKAVSSVNYGGIAFKTTMVTLENISVNADFTSYNYNEKGENISTTYMVSGGVCEAGVATTMKNIKVVVNANKNITNKTLNYGATFFGGLVARYTGDKEGFTGLSIQNSVVSGDVYFNHSYESLKIGENTYNVFIAGGLIGSIQTKDGATEYVDALGMAKLDATCEAIVSNKVQNLIMTIDIKSEVMQNEGYRAKGVGALLGALNADYTAPSLNLSSNTIEKVEIIADEETFTYSYEIEGGSVVENVAIGANKQNSYGASYAWNLGLPNKVVNPDEMDVKYTALEK